MAGRKGSPTGRCQGCNHSERVRIERLLAAGASIKGAARKFAIDYHALHRHWRHHVSAEARATCCHQLMPPDCKVLNAAKPRQFRRDRSAEDLLRGDAAVAASLARNP